MREIIGAFEIGVMPAPEAVEPSIETKVDQRDVWPLFAALLVQVFACFSQAH
ncbi:hypothetical protein [Pseudomonas cavernicola]|uniref:hypothetical protein n=1 Tax=Pseudomonas cavernicola TaxID=2320866 RepID=UPI0013146683|nr:hypothetical protein [Pseudomonas cavernicola]